MTKPIFIDGREEAPSASTWDMFESLDKSASVDGGLAVAVPAELKALELLHELHGRAKWADVVRPARDLARKLGKDVELELHGEETELDRSIIDDLADPLVHLVRNAVDHGIESAEDRRAAGKPEKSVVRLSAK